MSDEETTDSPVVEPVETQPLLRVLTADATPEEVAAVVAVFSALGSGEEPPAPPRSEWSAHHRKMRAPVAPGHGGWKASALPR